MINTYCGHVDILRREIIGHDDHNNHLEAEGGEHLAQVMKNSFDFTSALPPAHRLNHYIQIITLLKMQTSGPRILFGYHYVDAVSTLELLQARPRRGFS